MNKLMIPSLLMLCAFIAIFSPWSGSAVAGVDTRFSSEVTPATSDYHWQRGFAFERGGYRHAMPTWR